MAARGSGIRSRLGLETRKGLIQIFKISLPLIFRVQRLPFRRSLHTSRAQPFIYLGLVTLAGADEIAQPPTTSEIRSFCTHGGGLKRLASLYNQHRGTRRFARECNSNERIFFFFIS